VCNFGDIWSRNPRVHAVNNNTFCGDTANISEYPILILTYFTGLVDILVGMIIPIGLADSFGSRPRDVVTLLWQGDQLNLEDGRRHRQERTLLLASAFDNGLADRKSAFKRLNDIFGLYHVFGELASNNLGVYAVKTRNFCRDSPAILRRSSFVIVALQNGLEDRNFDFSRVNGNHFCTPCWNSVRFGLVTPGV